MKQKLPLLLTTLSIIFLFQSCSWTDYFCIYNLTDKPVLMEYSFYHNSRGFPLFETPTMHKMENGQIDWQNSAFTDYKENYKYDSISQIANVKYKFHLPPKCVVIIGTLRNSHYEGVNQDFINDRYFNLSELKIYSEKEELTITKSNFDTYFKNTRGEIAYKLK